MAAAAAPLAAIGAAPSPTHAKPLLMGNWADPSILKSGGDYYMTHSSFDFHPGLLIWRSRDLRNWKPLSRAVVNQSGSIWAPELIRDGNQYRIYYPADGQNWVITAQDPAGPWSAPLPIGAKRIDPGFVAGEDGKRYIHLSGGGFVEMSTDGLRAMGEIQRTYGGWPIPEDWAIECFCLESPKLIRKDGWYHLTSAQGGTLGPSTSHMVVSARSKSPIGPWENSPYNPVIKTWSRDEPWWSKGHGTLVEGPDGRWYCVLHGVRNGFRTLGRPTLIEPIEWTRDGWYRPSPNWPAGWAQGGAADMPMSDSFKQSSLGVQWQFHGHYDSSRFETGNGVLQLKGHGADAATCRPLTLMPMHAAYEIEVEVSISGAANAGLALFASPRDYIGYAFNEAGRLLRVQQGHRRYNATDEPAMTGAAVSLRIVNDRQDVRFYWRQPGGAWKILQPSMDVSAAGPLRPALLSWGNGVAGFREFRYTALAP